MSDNTPRRSWWWLSFVSSTKWLGACCVEADDIHDAVKTARLAGCNPGGEVMGWGGRPLDDPPPAELQYKLISDEAELDRICAANNLQTGKVPAGGPCVECEREAHEQHFHD